MIIIIYCPTTGTVISTNAIDYHLCSVGVMIIVIIVIIIIIRVCTVKFCTVILYSNYLQCKFCVTFTCKLFSKMYAMFSHALQFPSLPAYSIVTQIVSNCNTNVSHTNDNSYHLVFIII